MSKIPNNVRSVWKDLSDWVWHFTRRKPKSNEPVELDALTEFCELDLLTVVATWSTCAATTKSTLNETNSIFDVDWSYVTQDSLVEASADGFDAFITQRND